MVEEAKEETISSSSCPHRAPSQTLHLPGFRDVGWNVGKLAELDQIVQSYLDGSHESNINGRTKKALTLSITAFRASDQRCQLLVKGPQFWCDFTRENDESIFDFPNVMKGCATVSLDYINKRLVHSLKLYQSLA